jgi:hypothetical protein
VRIYRHDIVILGNHITGPSEKDKSVKLKPHTFNFEIATQNYPFNINAGLIYFAYGTYGEIKCRSSLF